MTVVVVDSLELELEEEYPDGDLAGGVTLLWYDGEGDGTRSMRSRKVRIGTGVSGRFLTGLNS
jgi:hypothetical protein